MSSSNSMKALLLLGALSSVSPMATADLNTGLMVHYAFDDCTAIDSSVNKRDGSIVGEPTCVQGAVGKALHFSGADYVLTGYQQSDITSYSLSAWIKVKSTEPGGVIFQNRGPEYGGGDSITLSSPLGILSRSSTAISLDSDNILTGISNSAKNVKNGFWHHIVGTWQAPSGTDVVPGQFLLYIDGVKAATVNHVQGTSTSPLTGNGNAEIGHHAAWGNFFKGAIDEVRVYSRALSGTEIKQLYYQGIDISGTVKKFKTTGFSVVCENVVTGQSVTLKNKTYNCETSGLTVKRNDEVKITIHGFSE